MENKLLPYKPWKVIFPFLLGLGLYLCPHPEGVDPKGWHLFAIFLATISGVILKPLPMPAIALIGMLASILTNTLDITDHAFRGFASPVVWLIVFVFFIARAFIKTKLGHRIAYSFVAVLGKYTLGLGYGIALTELLIGPAIPSNTARAGGIIYPIVKSIAETLGSRPDDGTAKKLGSFLVFVAFQGNLIVSAMFLTSMAANPMIQSIALKYGVKITWSSWLLATIVPGLFSLILVPLVIYFIYPPKLKVLPQAVSIARKNLHDMGPMNFQEWSVAIVFFVMICFWIVGEYFDIPATLAGLFGLCILLLMGILTWKDVASEHEAWGTLIWLSILIMMSGCLEKFGMIDWFSKHISQSFQGFNPLITMYGLAIVYFYSHYFFASNTAHVGAMYGAFLAVSIAAGAPPIPSAMLLGCFSSLFSSMTHYSTGSAPVYFGMGYIGVGEWWFYGFLISLLNVAIWIGVGSLWWQFLGLM
jgi:DASS family divalent anion:Na+ symporter